MTVASRVNLDPSLTVLEEDFAVLDEEETGVCWGAVSAGAVAATALALVLVAFGSGIGLSMVSPWTDSGVSASTFKIGAGIYLCVVAVMSSAVGGYLAARLRTKWGRVHTNEVFFRDTAQGFLAWAFATLISLVLVGAVTSGVLKGTAQGAGAAAGATNSINPSETYVDKLLRAGPATQPAAAATTANTDTTRPELVRLWSTTVGENGALSPADHTYAAQLVAARTGLSQTDAQQRVEEVVTEAKVAADQTRKAAMQLSFWLAASMLLGAFAASLAAVEGGQLRDGTWSGRILTPRAI